MSRIGIIGAMDIEVADLTSRLADMKKTEAGTLVFYEGKLEGKDAVIVKCGVGKVNAALCTQRLIIQFGVTCVINTGIAGSMAQNLNVFDFVVSTDALYHDVDASCFGYKPCEIPQMKVSDFAADPELIRTAQESFAQMENSRGHKIIAGRIASGDQFISDRSVKEHIRTICNPCCVEMEGAAIAHACSLNSIPFVIIRCMSDNAEEATKAFNEKDAASLSASLVLAMVKKL